MSDNNNSFNWGGAVGGVAGGVLGMIGQGRRAKKQHNRQKELMGIQFGNQQELNKQGQKLQMKTWKDTGYGAQMEMMKEAGLNPGLMYGMSGGGGQTTGSQSGGSAQSGNSHAPMDIGNSVQSALAMSQIKLSNSQANKNDVEASKIADVDTEKVKVDTNKIRAEIENIAQQTTNEKEKEALLKIQQNLGEEQINKVRKDTEKVGKEISSTEKDIALKEYEIGLNKLGIQKGDNKIFRYISKLASDNGFDLVGLIKAIFSNGRNIMD